LYGTPAVEVDADVAFLRRSESRAAMQARPWMPYALVAPSILFLGALFIVPLVQTIWLSVASDGGPSLANYQRMAGDLNFGAAVRNTFLLTLVVVPLQIASRCSWPPW
jgi:ABC-type sugar transport system permease subunit